MMREFILGFGIILLTCISGEHLIMASDKDSTIIRIKKCDDFEVTGDGSNEQWDKSDWVSLPQRKTLGNSRETRVKILYSGSGIYFLFYCQDTRLTATLEGDFLDLWNEDVVEVFLWTDEAFPVYFEYELSPLNYELPILVPNLKGKFLGWRPWHYQGERKTRHATAVQGGQKKGGASISAWTAEFFIPYVLLEPLGQVPPGPGTHWRANLYRGDYDREEWEYWAWQPIAVRFHEYEKFGTLIFE